jgi:hypothetical protein
VGQGEFLGLVNAALDEVVEKGLVSFPWSGGEKALYSQMVDALKKRGLDSNQYGEELAVAKESSRSENYDLLLSNGNRRTGPGAFASFCKPATRSDTLTQAPPPSTSCPFTHAEFLSSGRWQSFKVTAGAGTRKNVDATPVTCNAVKCAEIGWPTRQCCPAGTEEDSNLGECNVEMSRPVWSISGGSYCADGGPEGLWNNPLRNCMIGSGKIKVCSGESTKCVEAPF